MMRWHNKGQSCIRPSIAFPSLGHDLVRDFRDHARLFRFRDRRPSPVAYKVNRRARRRNGFVMSYGTGPISASLRHVQVRRSLPTSGSMRLLIAFFWLASAGGGLALAEHAPLPRPHPPLWIEPQTFREAAGPDFSSTDITNTPTECDQRLQL